MEGRCPVVHPEEVYRRLLAAFGPQGWWPAETRFEVMVGAILTQQTAWTSVEGAVERLKEKGLLEPGALATVDEASLAGVLRPTGFYRQKAVRLRGLAVHLVDRWGGDLDPFFAREESAVREELLALNGVGPETADSILLYAGGFPTFVIDAYTLRFMRRMWSLPEPSYAEAKAFFEAAVPKDVGVYGEYHGLLVELGKRLCRREPRCGECPLQDGCGEGQKRLKAGGTWRGGARR